MGYRIVRDETAFANAPATGKKRPRKPDNAHLEFIRTLPCLITGKRPVEAAHVRYDDAAYGKRCVGVAEKPDDRWTVPLCPEKHREQHGMNEREFWAKHGIDPLKVAISLYFVTGDSEQAELILRKNTGEKP